MKPEQIWPDYALSSLGIDREKIIPISEELAHMWEITYYSRKMRAHVPELLQALQSMGLHMGVISNTPSLFQVFDTLEPAIAALSPEITIVCVSSDRKDNRPAPNVVALLQQ